MHEFIPGQRWISDTELQMGLGTVLSVDARTVTVLFLATEEVRTYSRQTAPLSRAAFAPGDRVRSHKGWSLDVESVIACDGLLTYHGRREDGDEAQLPEGELDNLMQLNRPADRLFTGQIDPEKWFILRQRTRNKAASLAASDLQGLTGARTSLIPHQLYIAHEVAARYAPRVLLADEVGLGKTIEAGLILHHQLLNERVRRVLIIVPENLQHQWLVEMRRRFNLHFSLFDEERCRAAEESENGNPFQTEQLVLCSLAFLVEQPSRFEQALQAGWDLLVVDEAHHLQWSPKAISREYRCVEQLAERTTGVLLLTATPEQLGKQGHFARLRLLDPDRFPNYDRFVAEEQAYEPIAGAVEELLAGTPLSEAAESILRGTVNEGDNRSLLDALVSKDVETSATAREKLIDHLLDRHGTGRVLFRNTRAAVKGFPKRQLHAIPLPLPEAYAESLETARTIDSAETVPPLCPERLYQEGAGARTPWTRIDPRINWLVAKLKQLRPEKVVVITASMETAEDLAEALRVTAGIHAALFHEGKSLLERDRSAAFFADQEYGSPVLVCSEIGSEGRNLQFAHHLVLFDLPLNPDLLEQRIGRLDRIGQAEAVHIHVPYLDDSPQSVLFHWYHEGLGAFEHTCPTGHSVFVQVEPALQEALYDAQADSADLPALIAATRQLNGCLTEALHRGRDRLLEYNSCRPRKAEALTQRVRAETAASEADLLDYLEELFDAFGVELEEHSERAFIIRPGPHMQEPFPGLPEDGLTFTCHRDTALTHEDMEFFTWEHPLVLRGMEMMLSGEQGNTAITAVKHPSLKPGTLLLECIYLLESASNRAVQSGRYLPSSGIRVVVDTQGQDYAAHLSEASLGTGEIPVESETARQIVHAYQQPLRDLLRIGEATARLRIPELLAQARRRTDHTLGSEIDRMRALRRVNPNVRQEEVDCLERRRDAIERAIASANLRLDAQRVIVAT